ncbi:hypothetical protein Moror_17316 [Moniliophthora roreri MCA 2997]|uniref:T6SS Phospholipase effector Tle1-like catalytic domain-containing protein n=1 Tax=Moniliophthora roreri (strain MCA 2997) TaxID=1381753 RepID=V2XVU4_MONRO|nr:hypothetical protein Moror_17316 [Moniliophthora roreri MCA 2997]
MHQSRSFDTESATSSSTQSYQAGRQMDSPGVETIHRPSHRLGSHQSQYIPHPVTLSTRHRSVHQPNSAGVATPSEELQDTEEVPTQCHSHSKGRNLVVCIDGTSNRFSRKNTNVVELYSRLLQDERQLTFYNSGIGTYANPSRKSLSHYKQVILHKLDLAFAWRFERILLSAYRWLSERYEHGDRIFLFGFSRGAYQVRALSAMIEKVGLIHRGNEDQIPFAYELYCASSDNTITPTQIVPSHYLDKQDAIRAQTSVEPCTGHLLDQDNQQLENDMASCFKRTFSVKDVKVHFIGAWDTVSSVGLARSKKDLPLTTSGMKHVCYFRHALALDERRVKFLPEFARGGTAPCPKDCQGEMPHTKELRLIDFSGGGNTENTGLDINGPSLRWMVREAKKAGLRMEPFFDWGNIQKVGHIHESLSVIWRPLEYFPLRRLSYGHCPDSLTRRYVESNALSKSAH